MGIFVRKKNPVEPGSVIGPRQMSWTGGLETIDLSPTLLNMVAELGTVTLNYGGLEGDNTDENLQFGINPDRAFGKSAIGKWEITATALIWRDANNVITRQISSRPSAFVFEYASNDAGVAVVAGVSTFTPPVGWVSCRYQLVQGGAGGGSGRNAGTGLIRLGGTGGIGGLRSDGVLVASHVPAGAWTVTVGAGGAGGAGVSNNTGTNGSPGGATFIAQGATVLASAAYTASGAPSANVGVGVGGDGSASRAGTTSTGSGTPMWFSPPSGAVTSSANAPANYFSPQGGTSGPGGGSVEASGNVWAPGTGNGGAQTGGAASNGGGGSAPTGTATGWGTGGAGAGGGTNVSPGAAGGNGTGGVAILVFSF